MRKPRITISFNLDEIEDLERHLHSRPLDFKLERAKVKLNQEWNYYIEKGGSHV